MIRRWSYVNNINTSFFNKYLDLNFVHYETTFKANIHFKKNIPHISKLSRKSWARRRHLTNWIVYQNVFSNWSNDYLFFKQYSKFIFNYQLFKNSFLTFNLFILKKNNNSYIKGIESFVSSSFVNKISNYFNNSSYTSYLFFQKLKQNSWMFISIPGEQTIAQITDNINLNPIYGVYQKNFFPVVVNNNKIDLIEYIWSNLWSLILFKSIEIYKIITILTLLNLK
jgi:hypothetical protein